MNGLPVYAEFLDAAMEQLRDRFLRRAPSAATIRGPTRCGSITPVAVPELTYTRPEPVSSVAGGKPPTPTLFARAISSDEARPGSKLARLIRLRSSLATTVVAALVLFAFFFAIIPSNSGMPLGGITPPAKSAFTAVLNPLDYVGRPAGEVAPDLRRAGFGTRLQSRVGTPPDVESECTVIEVAPSGEVVRGSQIVLTCEGAR